MLETLKILMPKQGPARYLWALYIITTFCSLYIIFSGTRDQLINNAYGLLLGSIPFLGGLYGLFFLSREWGGSKSALGRSVIFLSLGLIFWAIGTYIFSGYYNLIASVEVPYPSIADLAYILSWPLWGIGMYHLSQATGAKFGLKRSQGKALLFILPAIVITGSYYLLIMVARDGVITSDTQFLKIFFDLFYPIGDIVILTVATLVFALSYDYFGGVFKTAIYIILFGFVLNYLADFLFSYSTTLETFYAGGSIDLLFTTALFVLTLGVTLLDPRELRSTS